MNNTEKLLLDFMQHLSWYYNIDEVIDCSKHQNVIEKYIKSNSAINCAVPEWLTDELRALAKVSWYEHKDLNDNKRIEAMRIVQRGALATGYTIGIKKATELLQQHCL